MAGLAFSYLASHLSTPVPLALGRMTSPGKNDRKTFHTMRSLEAEGDQPGQVDLCLKRLKRAGQRLCRTGKAGPCPSAFLGVSVSHTLHQTTPISISHTLQQTTCTGPWVRVQNTEPCPQRESFREINSTPVGVGDPLPGHLGPGGKTIYTSYSSKGSFPLGGHALWG